jgi:spermidine synthase
VRIGPAAHRALGWCQLLLAGGIAWTAYMIADSLPYWPINPLLAASPWFIFQLDMARCLWAILPPALLWGASFPLALCGRAGRWRGFGPRGWQCLCGQHAGRHPGRAAGEPGLVPAIGTQQTERVLLVASAGGGLFALAPYVRRSRSKTARGRAGGLR